MDRRELEAIAKKVAAEERQEMYEAFAYAFDFCFACWWRPGTTSPYKDLIAIPMRLENAHIQGGEGRSHDRRNVNRLCTGCHQLNTGYRIRLAHNRLLPTLELEHMLWLKKENDPSFYDRKYLSSLRSRALPPIHKLPMWFFDQRSGSPKSLNYKHETDKPRTRTQALDELAEQAQELDMGYSRREGNE